MSCCAFSLLSTSGQGPRKKRTWVVDRQWIAVTRLHPHEKCTKRLSTVLSLSRRGYTQTTNVKMLTDKDDDCLTANMASFSLSQTLRIRLASMHAWRDRQWATSGTYQRQGSGRELVAGLTFSFFSILFIAYTQLKMSLLYCV